MANAGAFKKGEKRPNQGRPKGKVNKETALIRDMVGQALTQAGGVDYLARMADEHPGPFLALVGKTMPIQVSSDPNQPMRIEFGWKSSE